MLSDLAEMAIARCQRPFDPPLSPDQLCQDRAWTPRPVLLLVSGREPMAKGQKRSNREQRKPKKAPAPVKTETPFGAQVKSAGNSGSSGRGK